MGAAERIVYRRLHGELVKIGYERETPRSVVGENGAYVGPILEEDILEERGTGVCTIVDESLTEK